MDSLCLCTFAETTHNQGISIPCGEVNAIRVTHEKMVRYLLLLWKEIQCAQWGRSTCVFSLLEILPEISRTLLAAARHDVERGMRRRFPECPYTLVYTSVMMVYGRWRRRPHSGRVGHAVNRRTQPRQNLLLYGRTAERKNRRPRWLAYLRADAR